MVYLKKGEKNIMNRDEFKEVMNSLRDVLDWINDLYSISYIDLLDNGPLYNFIKCYLIQLHNIFPFDYREIDWFVFEKDFGRNRDIGGIIHTKRDIAANGLPTYENKEYKMDSIDDFYNYLMDMNNIRKENVK